jgi:hypothetical protein
MASQRNTSKDEFELRAVQFSRLTRRGFLLGLSLPQLIVLAIGVLSIVSSPGPRPSGFCAPCSRGRRSEAGSSSSGCPSPSDGCSAPQHGRPRSGCGW